MDSTVFPAVVVAIVLMVSRVRHAAIVGGGLAGLSTAVHLLEKSPNTRITVVDKSPVGCGGASSVAGGLVHPLSPRGKLVHWGIEGMASTNRLVELALAQEPSSVLADYLYRVAWTEKNVHDLKRAGIGTWLEPHEAPLPQEALGALKLSLPHGRVLHVPSYLEGLWKHCCTKYPDRIEWTANVSWESFDLIVGCAGAGMWEHNLFGDLKKLPVQLIRGQSLQWNQEEKVEPLLFGKYVVPTPQGVLVGATHEFDKEPWSQERVQQELLDRIPNLLSVPERVVTTSGVRVQSQRGALGRLPIVGRVGDRHWIFTGLSSRGLLYHGIYGDVLTDAMLFHGEDGMHKRHAHTSWWSTIS